jgi:hypothetical protein
MYTCGKYLQYLKCIEQTGAYDNLKHIISNVMMCRLFKNNFLCCQARSITQLCCYVKKWENRNVGNGLGDSTNVVLDWPNVRTFMLWAFHTTVTLILRFTKCMPRRVMDRLRIEAATGGQSNTRRRTSGIISVIGSCYGDWKKVNGPGGACKPLVRETKWILDFSKGILREWERFGSA